MLLGANYVIPSGFCLSRIIFYNPAIPSGLKPRNISYPSKTNSGSPVSGGIEFQITNPCRELREFSQIGSKIRAHS